jgi:hypothetical protein
LNRKPLEKNGNLDTGAIQNRHTNALRLALVLNRIFSLNQTCCAI